MRIKENVLVAVGEIAELTPRKKIRVIISNEERDGGIFKGEILAEARMAQKILGAMDDSCQLVFFHLEAEVDD